MILTRSNQSNWSNRSILCGAARHVAAPPRRSRIGLLAPDDAKLSSRGAVARLCARVWSREWKSARRPHKESPRAPTAFGCSLSVTDGRRATQDAKAAATSSIASIAIALLLPSSATAQSLSALVSVNSSSLSIASLHQENGTVSRILPPFSASGGGLSGECNAGFDGLRYYKNTADGYLHTVYAPTGHVMGKVALRNHPGKPGTETFLAGPDAEGNLWFAEPLEYTSYSIFKIDSITGIVTEVATLPKQQLDGIGVCVGAIAGNKLLYIVADTLVSFDLTSHNVTEISKGFYAPLTLDPSHAGHILALHMGPAVQAPGARRRQRRRRC